MGIRQLQSFISYKAELTGVPVAFVDPHNTSRKCPECGSIDKRNRPAQSVFCCESLRKFAIQSQIDDIPELVPQSEIDRINELLTGLRRAAKRSCGHSANADAIAAENIRRVAVNRPNAAGVDVSGVHYVRNEAELKLQATTSVVGS